MLQFVLSGGGGIDRGQLEIALKVCNAEIPGMHLQYSKDSWHLKESPIPVTLVEGQTEGRDMLDIFSSELERKIDPRNGTMEVFLAGENNAMVLFRFFHGVTDGQGALTWLRRVFQIMKGLPPQSFPKHEGIRAAAPMVKTAHQNKGIPDLGPSRVKRTFTSGNEELPWYRLPLPGRDPAWAVKAALVISRLFLSSRSTFLIPVDLRRHSSGNYSLGNFTSPIFLPVYRSDDISRLRGRLLAALRNNQELTGNHDNLWGLSGSHPRILRAAVRYLDKIQSTLSVFLAAGLLSNMGSVDIQDFSVPGFYPADFFLLPIRQPLTPFTLVGLESGGTTHLVFAGRKGILTPVRMKKIEYALRIMWGKS